MKNAGFAEIILVFLMAIIAFGYFSPAGYFSPKGDWNANSRLALVKAVVEEGRFEIDDYSTTTMATGDKARFNGHFYSDKAIGSALLGIEFYGPLYAISNNLGHPLDTVPFQELITFLAVGLICAVLVPLVYSFVKGISGSAAYSLLISLAVCVGTPFYFYGTVYYGHSLAGTFLFIAFLLWFNMKNDEQISLAKTLISAYFLGYAFITEYTTAIIVLLIGLYILYVIWKQKQLLRPQVYVLLAVGFLAPLTVALLYNQAVFHNPFSTGYGYEALPQFSTKQGLGLMGIGLPDLTILFYMTFHTTMGIFWQSPVLLLAFIGWVVMWRNSPYRAEGLLSFGIILLYLVIFSGYFTWWGGAAFTPRFITPIFPFFAVPLAFLPRKAYLAAGVLTFIAVAQMLFVSAASNDGLRKIVNPIADGHYYTMFENSINYNVYFKNFLARRLSTNRGSEFLGLPNLKSLLPLLVAEIILLGLFVKSTCTLPAHQLARFWHRLATGMKKSSG